MKYSTEERCVIDKALSILRQYAVSEPQEFTSPAASADFFKLHLAGHEREVFSVMFLNAQHVFIAVEDMFMGTVDGAAVYPREIVKSALKHNAVALVLAHNHPSGLPEPSTADKRITERLVQACALVDIRILDHIIVADDKYVSFAKEGLM